MAVKASSGLKNKDTHKIKYVKKARMWVETVVENGKQTQTWHEEKPNGIL